MVAGINLHSAKAKALPHDIGSYTSDRSCVFETYVCAMSAST